MPIGLTPIRDIDDNTAQWGVLACGLSNLTRLGAPVPPGFVLPAAASRRFLTRGDLDPSIVVDLPARIDSIDRQLVAMTQDQNRPLLDRKSVV